ncbi:MAG: ribonucleotide-diphosphate reductase subunit beta [Halobacteriales archaeon]
MSGTVQYNLERARKPFRYYRNAVSRHWDPEEIDLDIDRERLAGYDFDDLERDFDYFRQGLALFGAGEESVTEDLAPLQMVLEDIEDEMFVSTQIYEEAKHTEFFDRYWREVVNPVEETLGLEASSPRDDHYFTPSYVELFDRNQAAMERLLDDDTPENRVRAHAHYHLVIEGILAQTGYYGLHNNFGPDIDAYPHLPGLVEGFANIRSDEGRHVGYGMYRIKHHVTEDDVALEVLNDTVNELMPLTQGIVEESTRDDLEEGVTREDLAAFAAEKHSERMEQITSVDDDLPDIDELTEIETV